MLLFRSLAAIALTVMTGAPAHAAGDVAAGRKKAQMCQACHGLDGLSKLPGAPHIAGQPASYLIKALGEFKSGVRKNEVMSVAASSLSEADIENLAAYYAAIKITVEPPK